MRRFRGLLALAALAVAACGSSGAAMTCDPSGSDLGAFDVARIGIGGVAFEAWVADTLDKQVQGFRGASPHQLESLPDGTPRGMLFLFASDGFPGFVMSDTCVPLDLAFFRADGVLVETHALTPYEAAPVFPDEPIRYALEVNAGDLAAHGIGVGDALVLPIP